jgi:hypothetical protein
MKTKPFNIDVIKTHKGFFLLNKLPKNSEEVLVGIKSPSGFIDVDFVDVFTMKDGSLLAAWKHPFQKLGLHNLIAKVDDYSQILNLYTVERVIDIYNQPVDSDFGVFVFSKSEPVDSGDWRCDRGYYGPSRFVEDIPTPMLSGSEEIVVYEPFLSVTEHGHIFYMKVSTKFPVGEEKINNSIIPTITRTFQEIIKLVYEWSILSKEPFNDTSEASVAAKKYFDALMFSKEEIAVIESINPMQISQFLNGSTTARVRPTLISEMTTEIENLLFDRLASSSVSFIVSRNPELWDLKELLQEEQEELKVGIERFKTYYIIPINVEIEETEKVKQISKLWVPNEEAYVHNQLRNFKNKKAILDGLTATS